MRRVFYKIISPLRKLYWFFVRPNTRGVKILIESDGKFLMIRNTYGIGHWTFPGGGVKRGEDIENAAKREAYEEVGIEFSELEYLGDYKSIREYKNDTVSCYYGKVKNLAFQIYPGEVAEAKWVLLTAIPRPTSPAVQKVLNLYKNTRA